MLPTRDSLKHYGYSQTECEGMEKIFQANRNQKKAGVVIFISDKIDVKSKTVTQDKVIIQ